MFNTAASTTAHYRGLETKRFGEESWPHGRTVGKQFPPYDSKNSDGVQHAPRSWSACILPVVYLDAIINAVQTLMGCEEEQLQMELFNLLINPVSHNFALRWHRDDISGDATEEEERRALDAWKPHGVCPPALYEDSCLFIVLGSHKVPRTPEQRQHSEGQECQVPADPLDMPGAIRVSLKPGDSVLYNSNILHCATYDAQAPQATLHASMGNVAGGSVPRAQNILQHRLRWMKEPQFSDGLDSRGKAMLGRLLELYNAAGVVGYSLSG
ncbi:hypothetical protein B0H19DRAFT_1221688 [Mycena capillaripes]|nr:hypothetical protein B0H19DRAFT_1221688 [Mycena capillaripes]